MSDAAGKEADYSSVNAPGTAGERLRWRVSAFSRRVLALTSITFAQWAGQRRCNSLASDLVRTGYAVAAALIGLQRGVPPPFSRAPIGELKWRQMLESEPSNASRPRVGSCARRGRGRPTPGLS